MLIERVQPASSNRRSDPAPLDAVVIVAAFLSSSWGALAKGASSKSIPSMLGAAATVVIVVADVEAAILPFVAFVWVS